MRRIPSREAPTACLADVELSSLDEVKMWDGQRVKVAGQDIFVRATPPTRDDAEPALFVHGLGGASINWTDFAALLRDRLAIEALDLPGFGRSGPARGDDYTLDAHARTVIAYLEQSKRGPVHLVGNSMGGAICLIVAARRPDLVRTLTLISPAVPDRKIRAHVLKSDWRMGLLIFPILGMMALRKLGQTPVETRVKGTIALCFADPSRLSKQRYDEMVAEARARAEHPWVDLAMLRSTRGLVRSQFLKNRSGWAAMRTITAPTLVLWGDEDKLVAADLAPFVAAEIPNARLLVLEHVGHVAMMEDPQTSARAQIALLDDAAAQSTTRR
ncbi:MAG TPA: alpha/beta hydrolase [Jatrophihabitantaceae bacterium]|nr:alpha/beta hydrolase [Jatrophihabitantaceae bacterium]